MTHKLLIRLFLDLGVENLQVAPVLQNWCRKSAVSPEIFDMAVLTIRNVLSVALILHGVLALVYGAAALTHPEVLEPFHRVPSPDHLHYFELHGVSMLFAGLLALCAGVLVRDRVIIWWTSIAAALWAGAQLYVTYRDLAMSGLTAQEVLTAVAAGKADSAIEAGAALGRQPHATWALAGALGSIVAVHAAALLLISCVMDPQPPSHRVDSGHHAAHHARQASAAEKAAAKRASPAAATAARASPAAATAARTSPAAPAAVADIKKES